MKQFYVYILASRPGGSLYVGVTSDLVRRVYEHKNALIKSHTGEQSDLERFVRRDYLARCLPKRDGRDKPGHDGEDHSIGTMAASFDCRSTSEVFTLRTLGAEVSFSTKP